MDPRSRAALIQRIAAVIGADKPFPNDWNELSLTEQLMVEQADPIAAAVLKGKATAEVELELLQGTFPADAPAVKSLQEQREEAIAAALAGLPAPKTAEQVEAERLERQAMHEAARRNSFVAGAGRWQ